MPRYRSVPAINCRAAVTPHGVAGTRLIPLQWLGKNPVKRSSLLDQRLCDLGLRIEASPLREDLDRLGDELGRAGLRFRPDVWFSTDWFTPHGVPGFAIPFYLAERRFASLERRMGGEVEGGSRAARLRLLRHETGHAVDNAYRLHRRASWREHFGPFSRPYRVSYRARPRHPDFVVNLPGWYAQSHPGEDFAETFAVWLDPDSQWRARYAGTQALHKLEYVDALMREVGPRARLCRTRERTDSLPKLRYTLREHYRRRRVRYAVAHARRSDPEREYYR